MNHTFFGNSCVSGWVYYYQELKYGNPFIWHLILDDEGFVKMSKNYDYYINQTPIFIKDDDKNGRYLNHHSISKTYPIMRLGDVNIHYIHHTNELEVYDTFCRRLDRSRDQQVIPVAWNTEIKNRDMLHEFDTSVPNSIVAKGTGSQVDAAKIIIKEYNEKYNIH